MAYTTTQTAYIAPPSNMIAATINDTPTGLSLLTANGKASFTGIGNALEIVNITGVTKTAYAAGTLQIATLTISGTPDTVTAYYFYVQATGQTLDANNLTPYIVFATAATATSLGDALAAAITADPNAIVSATNSSGTVTLTELNLQTQGFLSPNPPKVGGTATAFAVTTAHVDTSGTAADVAQYVLPGTVIANTQYDKYVIAYRKPTTVNEEGKIQFIPVSVVVWYYHGAAGIAGANLGMLNLSGAVTQATNATTAVVLNSAKGLITSVALTNASVTPTVFALTNSTISATSYVVANIVGGTWTTGTPVVAVGPSGSGTVNISVSNAGTAALNGTVVIGYQVVNQ